MSGSITASVGNSVICVSQTTDNINMACLDANNVVWRRVGQNPWQPLPILTEDTIGNIAFAKGGIVGWSITTSVMYFFSDTQAPQPGFGGGVWEVIGTLPTDFVYSSPFGPGT